MESHMSAATNQTFNDAIAEWADDEEEGEEGSESVEEVEVESASREDEGDEPDDADKAAKEIETSGPEWAQKRLGVVAKQRRAAEEKADKLQKENEALVQRLTAAERLGRSSSRDPDPFAEDDNEPATVTSESRLELLERREAQRELDAMVASTKSKYPTLPDWVINGAIARGADIDEVGTRWEADLAVAAGTSKVKSVPKKPITVTGKSSAGRGEPPEKKKSAWEGRRKVDIKSLAKSVFDDIMGE
jgi:hypothetical protein